MCFLYQKSVTCWKIQLLRYVGSSSRQGTGKSVYVHADSQVKTVFVTHQGFQVMPFGVMNAPAVFQRLMQRVLSGLQFASVYLNDAIVYSETLEEHVNYLKAIFERLRKANLKLKPEKCKFV